MVPKIGSGPKGENCASLLHQVLFRFCSIFATAGISSHYFLLFLLKFILFSYIARFVEKMNKSVFRLPVESRRIRVTMRACARVLTPLPRAAERGRPFLRVVVIRRFHVARSARLLTTIATFTRSSRAFKWVYAATPVNSPVANNYYRHSFLKSLHRTSTPLHETENITLLEETASGRMLEVSRTVNAHSFIPESKSRPPSSGEALKEYAYKLCKDYLRGAWLNISAGEMILKKVSGGLSNLLYYCSLPDGVDTVQGEPSRLLLRLYGNLNGSRAIETLVTESVIFTLLSESQRGPRLYGVFSGGRLEEYIPARPLLTTELSDPHVSALIADKIAQIHLMDVPINKQPKWLWHTMQGWVKQIEELIATDNIQEDSREMINTMKALNLSDELVWLKEFLVGIKSPVVFCHNDLQEGNILMREQSPLNMNLENGNVPVDTTISNSDSLVVIDFEYCSYNYRGFDFANHFNEWFYDYSNQEPPYFYKLENNQADIHHKEHLVRSYLAALRKYPEYKEKPEDNLQTIMREIEAFTLASHFFWGLWSVLNSSSEINFDYWSYGESRFQSYYSQKNKILAEFEFTNGV